MRRHHAAAALGALVVVGALLPPLSASAAAPEDSVAALQRLPGGGLVRPIAGNTRQLNLKAVDGNGNGVGGVTPVGRVVSGPNAATADAAGAAVSCDTTRSDGATSCTFTPQRAGTDTVRVHVDQSGGRSGMHDPGEPFLDSTFTTEPRANTTTTDARVLTMDPESTEFSSRADVVRSYFAKVRDRAGVPVQGVAVEFTEEGAGRLEQGEARVVRTTDEQGVAQVTAGSNGESGTQVITGRIVTEGTECTRPADEPSGATAGVCSDTSTVTYGEGLGPQPPPPASPSPSPVMPPRDCRAGAEVTLERDTITATGEATVIVREIPHTVVDLYAYTRPSTEYRLVRSKTTDSAGVAVFTIRPPANTRLKAAQREEDCTEPVFGTAPSVVLNVRTALTLTAAREGVRDYTFAGDSLPARPGGLIVSLYRVTPDGRQVLTAQARASAATGQWSLNRRFTGTGRFDFLVRTGQDLQNAPGISNVRSTLIY